MTPVQLCAAERLEEYLGDPFDPKTALSFRAIVERDERDEYPTVAREQVTEWGLNRYCVPSELGGELASHEEAYALWRTIARRDMSLGVACINSFVGALPLYLSGNDAQQKRAAEIILREGGDICIGLTERDHGADLLASEVVARKVDTGYALSGEKWLINAGARSTAMTTFARDGDAEPPQYSLFFVDKRDLPSGTYTPLPKVPTLGIRGVEIAGIEYHDAPISGDARVGRAGAGLELTARTLMISRVYVTALSLGAFDTALRVTTDFALERRIYRGTAWDIPHVNRVLTNGFLDSLIADCVTTGALRAIHAAPQYLVLWSCLTKYFVPTALESSLRELSLVLGARFFLRDAYAGGIFQKVYRDMPIISVFEGSSSIMLFWTVQMLARLAADAVEPAPRRSDEAIELCRTIFDVSAPLETRSLGAGAKKQKLTVSSDPVTETLSAAVDVAAGEVAPPGLVELLGVAASIHASTFAEMRELARKGIASFNMADETFALAKRYAALFAAASCVQYWIHNRARLGAFASGEWLVLALHRILAPIARLVSAPPATQYERLSDQLLRCQREDRAFSMWAPKLAGRVRAA